MFGWLKEKSTVIIDTYKRDLSEFALAITPPVNQPALDAEDNANDLRGGRGQDSEQRRRRSGTTEADVGRGGGSHIKSLQRNPLTYTAVIAGEEQETFDEWAKGFSLDEKTEEISQLLVGAEMRRIHSEIVPEKVSYRDFWTRYFFRVHKLEMLKNLTDASYDDEFSWDMEEDDESPKTAPPTSAADTVSEKTSADNVKTQVELLEERNLDLERKIQQLQEELVVFSHAGDNSTTVPEQMAQLWRQRFEDMQKQNAILKEEAQMLQQEKRLQQQTTTRLERQVHSLSQQLGEWESERVKQERIAASLKAQINEQQNVISQLTSQIKAQFDTDERLRGHIDRLTKRIKQQQQQQPASQPSDSTLSPEPGITEELASLPKMLHVDTLLQQLSSKLRQFSFIDDATQPTKQVTEPADAADQPAPPSALSENAENIPSQASSISSSSATASDQPQADPGLSTPQPQPTSTPPSAEEWELVTESAKSDKPGATNATESKSDSDDWE